MSTPADSMTLAYITSIYARSSDTFIRSEVAALRKLGHTVHTYSVRRPDPNQLVSDEIRREHANTEYLVPERMVRIVIATLITLATSPARFFSGLALAMKIGPRGLERRVLQAVYFCEACYLARSMKHKGVQHLHNHIGENSATIALLASHIGGIPYSTTFHGPYVFYAARHWAVGPKVERSAFTAVISHFTKSQCMVFADYHHWDKLKVIRCCPDEGFLRREPTAVPATKRLMWVGRLCEEKGALMLLDAAAILAKQGVDFEVVMVGDGPLRPEIERMIARHGLQKNIMLHGWANSEQVIEKVLSSRALVSSSFAEGLPVVIMEALALSRPVIATSIAGVPELVEPGRNGWLVPAGSAEPLAEAMKQAIESPTSRLDEMGRAGAAKVRRQHNIAVEAGKLEALMRESIRRHNPAAWAGGDEGKLQTP